MRKQQGQESLNLESIASHGLVEYVPFPDALRGKYQCYTQADLTALRATGCDHQFVDVQTGVGKYVQWLSKNS
jgi:ADP-L-glycero-D-manno-heptose 6-epimerase